MDEVKFRAAVDKAIRIAVALAAARAWKRAETEGRVQKHGARNDQPLGKIPKGLIANPRRRFSELYRANGTRGQLRGVKPGKRGKRGSITGGAHKKLRGG
jgi:hypothetical protein